MYRHDPQEYDDYDFFNDYYNIGELVFWLRNELPQDTHTQGPKGFDIWQEFVVWQLEGFGAWQHDVQRGSEVFEDHQDQLMERIRDQDERLYDLIAEEVCDTVGSLIQAYDNGETYETVEC